MAFDYEQYVGRKLYMAEKGKVKSQICRSLLLNPTETHAKINRVMQTRGLPYRVEVKLETEGEHKNEIYLQILPRE